MCSLSRCSPLTEAEMCNCFIKPNAWGRATERRWQAYVGFWFHCSPNPIFAFRGRRGDRIKLLWWDGQRAEIERLIIMIAKLRRTQSGRSSKQLDAMVDQLQLSLEELEVSQDEVMPITEPAPRTVSRRKPLPEHLPRETHVHQPESQCSGCGGTLRQLEEDVSEVLEYIPARFRVIRHVRPKLVCRCCEHIAQVPAPSRPIARGLAGPGLLAHVLV